MRNTLGREGDPPVPTSARHGFLRQALLAWLAISVVTVGPYSVWYFWMDAPDALAPLFLPLAFLYSPAWRLAYAVGNSDIPLAEFGVFVIAENLLIAVALVSLRRVLANRRERRAVSRMSKPATPA